MIKPDLHRVRMEGAIKNKDFKVISRVAMMHDFTCLPYNENVNKNEMMGECETPYSSEVVTYSYQIDNHKIDVDLAITIGLGVIKNIQSGEEYLYNSDVDTYPEIEADELLKLGIYYQITHPEYHDKKLDILLNSTEGGEEFIRTLFTVHDDEPIKKLKEIFKSQKGKNGNVVPFRKK